MDDLKACHPGIEEVHFYSDGATSQFKQKYLFVNLTFLKEARALQKCTWNFFATSHRKGDVDGLGGTIKRLVWMQVLSRKTVVKDANTFFKCAEAAPSKVKVIHIPTADILSNQDVFEKRWEGCLSLPQTQSTHDIEAVEPYTVLSKQFADDILVTRFNFQAGIDSEFVETADADAKSAENIAVCKLCSNPVSY